VSTSSVKLIDNGVPAPPAIPSPATEVANWVSVIPASATPTVTPADEPS